MKVQSSAPARSRAVTAGPILVRENIGNVAVLALNRPQTRNSLSEAMLAALAQELTGIAGDRAVRVVVLTAKGPAFSGGHDLKELTARRSDPDHGRAYFRHIMLTCSAMMQQIVRLPQPVIAAVQGTATAAGCQLVASCDLAVASAEAKFGVSGINAGLFCSTPMVAAFAQRCAQARDGDAAHRRPDFGTRMRFASDSSTGWSRPAASSTPHWRSLARLPANHPMW